MKVKYESILEELIDKTIIDIRRYLVNLDDFETNQQYLGFKTLFRGYAITN